MTDIVVATGRGLLDATTGEAVGLEGSVDALSPDGRWAVVARRELWRNSDGWSQVAIADGWDLTSVMSQDEGAIVGTAEAHLLRVEGDRLERVETFEIVDGRDEWFTPWGGPPDVRSMTQMNSHVFVNVHVGGIVRGDGSKWEPTMDIGNDVHEVHSDGGTLFAACAVGLAQSDDAGASWILADEHLHATYARAITTDDECVYMSVARGPGGGDAAIYRKPRDGGPFARCDLPSILDNIDTGCLDATGSLVAFGTRDGDVFASRDRGATWERSASGLPPVRALRMDG
ncbi:MAG: WD40/YVTN/BNR-like repeat-containing protein [Actinomycetota bacterium]